MKEATGELNMTVVTVVAIVAVGAFFYAFIWPGIKDSIASNTVCANGQNYKSGTRGQQGFIDCKAASNGKYTCDYASTDENGKITIKTATCQTRN